jgi:hypothetical protein
MDLSVRQLFFDQGSTLELSLVLNLHPSDKQVRILPHLSLTTHTLQMVCINAPLTVQLGRQLQGVSHREGCGIGCVHMRPQDRGESMRCAGHRTR